MKDDFTSGWSAYYDAKEKQAPRKTLMLALDAFDREGLDAKKKRAADLACGNGVDTVEILRRQWQVLAADMNPEALKRLLDRTDLRNRDLLETRLQSLEEIVLSPELYLVNASYALPFCRPEFFPRLWDQIQNSLTIGGRFSGQFFGPKDTWTRNPELSFFSEAELREKFKSFSLEHWHEEEYDGSTALGKAKHWHVFNIVAQKRR